MDNSINSNTVEVAAIFLYFRETELYLPLFILEIIYRIKFIFISIQKVSPLWIIFHIEKSFVEHREL